MLNLSISNEDIYYPVGSVRRGVLGGIWKCDWMLINAIDSVIPETDIDLYRMYCERFGKDTSFNSDEELQELSSIYKKQIISYVMDTVYNLICDVVQQWTHICEREYFPSLFTVSVTSVDALNDMLNMIKQSKDAFILPIHTRFKSSLFDFYNSPFNKDMLPDKLDRILRKEQFLTYAEYIMKKVDRCFCMEDDKEINVSTYTTTIRELKDDLKSILLMCVPKGIDHQNIITNFYNTEILRKTDEEDSPLSNINGDIIQLHGFKYSHALCLNRGSIKAYVNSKTDPIDLGVERFIRTKFWRAILIDRANKDD